MAAWSRRYCTVSPATFLALPLDTHSFSASVSLARRALASRICLGSSDAVRMSSFFLLYFSMFTLILSAFKMSGTSSTLSNSTSTTAPITCATRPTVAFLAAVDWARTPAHTASANARRRETSPVNSASRLARISGENARKSQRRRCAVCGRTLI
jgi:hypothetical protein